MSPFSTPNTLSPFATKKDRTKAADAFAAMVRWCRARKRDHIDDCGEVDVTGLAVACAEAHGCDDPGEHHPAWDAAAEACG
jgi:hypothetical protein